MVTGSVMVRPEADFMVFTPSPGMSSLMVSAPSTRLVTAIASRNVHSVELQPPVPESPTELTVKVRAWAGLAASIMLTSATSSRPKARAFTCPNGL